MFTSFSSAPRIDEEAGMRNDGAVFYVGTTAKQWGRTITENKYKKVGMTKAAADSGVTAISGPTVTAIAKRMDAPGHWAVEVDSVTRGAWALET